MVAEVELQGKARATLNVDITQELALLVQSRPQSEFPEPLIMPPKCMSRKLPAALLPSSRFARFGDIRHVQTRVSLPNRRNLSIC